VRRDDNIREREQSHEHIVLDHRATSIVEEEIGFLLVDIQPKVANLAAFQRLDDGSCVNESAAAPSVPMIGETPAFPLLE